MKIYFDSTFLVSLYSPDANSAAAAVARLGVPGERLITSFGQLEVVNAFRLRVFRKEISAAQAEASTAGLARDLRDGIFQLLPLPEEVFGRALVLSRRTTARLGTRTPDLLHVAAALLLGADHLYSFDVQQRRLANAVHLKLN
ncbi:MAG: PIN domain-containing protein [Acidobacteriia bacterium]|nr:PIN domain-containing protein [Terriglobia bacterium]